MKKFIIFSLILISVFSLFVSCNSDADHGVYYQLASSYNKSKYEISGFLKKVDSAFYYYNSNGVFSFENKKHNLIVETSAKNGIISHAYLDSENNLYWQNREGLIFKNGQDEAISSNSYSHLWENGYVTSSSGLFKISEGSIEDIESKAIVGSLIYEDSILFWDSNDSYIYDGNNLYQIDDVTSFNGFVKVGTTYYVSQNLSLFKVDLEGNKLTLLTTFGYTLQDGGSLPMFTDGSFIYLKFSNLFYVYSETEDAKTPEVTSGWAQSISTATVISAEKTESSKQFYLSTAESGLYRIDIELGENSSIF